MKILFLADIFPYPACSGGRLRTYNLVKQLSKENTVDFICKNEEKVKEEDVKHFSKYLRNKYITVIDKKSIISRFTRLIVNKSDKLYLSHADEYQNKVNEWISKNQYDIVFADSLYMYQYVYNNKLIDRNKVKVVVDLHNVEHEIIYRMMENTESKLVKVYCWKEYKNVKRLECIYSKDVDLMFTVSERDRQEYIRIHKISEDKIIVIDNGVDLEIADNYILNEDNDVKGKFILFIGSLWYRPNREGISWFVENIWPNIVEKNNGLKLLIIGKSIESDIQKNVKNVEYLGFVDDIYEYYKKCECFVVPLKYGSGTRLKILEAMSFKIPIVSTTIGAEGLDVKNNYDIILNDDELEFANSINKILQDKELGKHIGEGGYKLVSSKYDWDKIGEKIKKSFDLIF